MQGTTQSTTESIHNKGGASQKRHSTPETLTPGTYAPPGDQSYRYASGRAFVSFVISIISLPLNLILVANMVSHAYRNIDLADHSLSFMQMVSFLALVFGPTGLVLGIQGFRECNRTPGLKGRTPAIMGITLSSMTIIIALAAAIWTAIFILADL